MKRLLKSRIILFVCLIAVSVAITSFAAQSALPAPQSTAMSVPASASIGADVLEPDDQTSARPTLVGQITSATGGETIAQDMETSPTSAPPSDDERTPSPEAADITQTTGAQSPALVSANFAVPASTSDFPYTVTSEAELNAAIASFNTITDAGTYAINFAENITNTNFIVPIDNAAPDVALVINGNGHILDNDLNTITDDATIRIRAGTTVSIDGLTIQNGFGDVTAGGIYNEGTLTLVNSLVQNNWSGGIDNEGFLWIENSEIANNQTSGDGGGIRNFGELRMLNSLVHGNISDGEGGGLWTAAASPAVEIVNTTFVGNSALLGGGIMAVDDIGLSQVTVAGNTAEYGGGIYLGLLAGETLIFNSIFADNTATSTPTNGDCRNDSPFDFSFAPGFPANNLIADGSCDAATNSQLIGDPMLGALQDNGGTTHTMALPADSIAVDAGDNAFAVEPSEPPTNEFPPPSNPLQTDQRGAGFPRILGGTVDLGAYEAASASNPPLAPPTNLTLSELMPFGLQLDWTDIDGETQYLVEESDNGGTTWTEVAQLDANTTQWQYRDLACETTMAYRLRAYDANADTYSEYVEADTTINQACAAVIDVNTTDPTHDGLCDTTHCSLADAMGIASDAYTDRELTINIPAGTYTTDSDGYFVSLQSFTMQGAGNTQTTLSGFGGLGRAGGGAHNTLIADMRIEQSAGFSITGSTAAVRFEDLVFTDTDDSFLQLGGSTVQFEIVRSVVSDVRASGQMFTISASELDGLIEHTWFDRTSEVSLSAGADGSVVTIRNSTFSNMGTDADSVPGTFRFFGEGLLNVTNSTFSGNGAAGEAAIHINGTAADLGTWTHVTLVGSDYGIDGDFPLPITVRNSLILGNIAPFAGAVGPGGEATTPTFAGVNITSGDAVLGPLRDNGGTTPTHALLFGSPALDAIAAGDCPLAADQRGEVRPTGEGCDVGAYETTVLAVCPAFPITVRTEAALNQAISCYNAQAIAGTYTIELAADITRTNNGTIIDNATTDVSLRITGNDHTISGNDTYRIFNIAANTSVDISNLTMTDGRTPFPSLGEEGGAILSYGYLDIRSSTIANSTSDSNGGGIMNYGNLNISESTITHNTGESGGGIANGGTLNIADSIVSDNNASSAGGILTDGQSTITGTLISGNTADFPAGGIGASGVTTIINSTVYDNSAGSTGGGLYGTEDLTIVNTTIVGNTAQEGAGVYIESANGLAEPWIANARLVNSIVADNIGGDCLFFNENAGTFTLVGTNLIEDSSCDTANDPNVLNVDPMLGALGDNGGATHTMALLAGSPAIDAGDSSYLSEATLGIDYNGDGDTDDTLATDQRGTGFPRAINAVDLGAYEDADGLPALLPASDFAVVAQGDDLVLSWTDTNDSESGFLLERRVAGDDPWAALAQLALDTTTYTDTVGCGAAHDYRLTVVRAQDSASSEPAEVSGATSACPPEGLIVTDVTQQTITIAWAAPADPAARVIIEWQSAPADRWRNLLTAPADETSYTLEGLFCGRTYGFRLIGVGSDGEASPPTEPLMVDTAPCTLSIVENLQVSGVQANQVTLTWRVPTRSNATHWIIRREIIGTLPIVEVGRVSVAATTFVDTTPVCGTQYRYTVTGYHETWDQYSEFEGVQISAAIVTTTPDCPADQTTVVGQYDPNTRQWIFNDHLESSSAGARFVFGPTNPDAQPLIGDWDGDGVAGIGLYANGLVWQRETRDGGPVDRSFWLGPRTAGMQAVAGDWNGDGTDTLALYKDGLVYYSEANEAGALLRQERVGNGQAGWQALAGDTNGDQVDEIVLLRGNLWLIPRLGTVSYGATGGIWHGVIGDWDDDGVDTIGVSSAGIWRLTNQNRTGTPDIGFNFGQPSDSAIPLVYTSGAAAIQAIAQFPATFAPVEPTPTGTPTHPPEAEATAPVAESTPEATPEATPPEAEATAPVAESTPEATPEATPPEAEATTPVAESTPEVTETPQ